MININALFRSGVNLMSNNAPAILTAFGAVGVVGTAVLTGKASFEAADRIKNAEFQKHLHEGADVDLTTTEKVKLVWPLYITAVGTGALSCTAIVMSHRISSRRAAVLAAAYALNQDKLEEYQDKVKEKFGVKKEKEVRDEVAADQVKNNYESKQVIFAQHDGDVLIHDQYSGRFFWGKKEEIDRAANEVNREILLSVAGYQTVSDFYDIVGLEHVSTSDYFGWNAQEALELDWSTTTTPDGSTPVHSFTFVNDPVMNPGSGGSPFR